MTLDAAQLMKLPRTELENLFRRSRVDHLPEGDADGTIIVAPGNRLAPVAAGLIRALAWQGKVFDPGGGVLRNKVTPFRIKAVLAKVYKDKSWFDGGECFVLDYSRTSLVARWIRDELREVAPGRFLGIAFWGKRKLGYFYLVFPD